MQALAHYALLGSLLAGAAGAVVIAAITVKYGFRRRDTAETDQTPADTAHRQRTIRLADTVAVLCFAVSAGLGVVGLMQHTRGVTPAVAAVDDAEVTERLQALERRLATSTPSPDFRGLEERLARLENRLGAVEDRAAVAERRAIASEQVARERRDTLPRTAPVAATPPRVLPPPVVVNPKPLAPPSPSASPALPAPAPAPMETVATPDLPVLAKPEVTPLPVAPAPAAVAAAREPVRPRVVAPPPAQEPSLTDKVRRDWEAVKNHVRRGGDEWREGWQQVKRLFAD